MSYKNVPVYRGVYEIKNLLDVITNNGGVVLGGYARYCVSPNNRPIPAGDVDIYCPNPDDFWKLRNALEDALLIPNVDSIIEEDVSCVFLNAEGMTYINPKQEGFTDLSKPIVDVGDLNVVNMMCVNNDEDTVEYYETPNSINYGYPCPESRLFGSPKIQLIKPVVRGAQVMNGDIETILDNFDFTITRAALQYNTDTGEVTGIVDEEFMEDEEEGVIRLRNIHCPIGNLIRMIKYMNKGYKPHTYYEFVKLFQDWEMRGDEWRAELVDWLEKYSRGELSDEERQEMYERMFVD